jgi:hypothetical protein
MSAAIAIRLEPIEAIKPRIAIDAAAEVARRIGCVVIIEVNGATVTIEPTTAKAAAFDAWSAAKAAGDAAQKSNSRSSSLGDACDYPGGANQGTCNTVA